MFDQLVASCWSKMVYQIEPNQLTCSKTKLSMWSFQQFSDLTVRNMNWSDLTVSNINWSKNHVWTLFTVAEYFWTGL